MAMGDVGRQVALCQLRLRVMESHELCYVRDAFEEQNEDIECAIHGSEHAMSLDRDYAFCNVN